MHFGVFEFCEFDDFAKPRHFSGLQIEWRSCTSGHGQQQKGWTVDFFHSECCKKSKRSISS